MNRVLFLIGYMGAGKSSLGKKLAKHFDMSFVDLDTLIETKENKSIQQIFDEHDETYFRALEAQVLRTTSFFNAIVATGGGTPCFHDNLNYMKEVGAVAYLLVPLSVLIGRLRQNRAERPLLNSLSKEDLDAFIMESFSKRKEIYERADFIILHNKPLTAIKRDLAFLLT